MRGNAFARLHAAHVAHRAEHHDRHDDALNAVEPAVADGLRLPGEGSEAANCVEKCREPFQPHHRPAVKPLETKIGNGFGDKAHGRKHTRTSTRSDLALPTQHIFRGCARMFSTR